MIAPITRAALSALTCMGLALQAGASHADAPDVDAWLGERIRTEADCKKAGFQWYDTPRLKGCINAGVQTGVWQIWNTEEGFLQFLIAKEKDQLNGPAVAFFPTGEVAATMMHKDEKLVGLKTTYWKNGSVRETLLHAEDGSGKRVGPNFAYAPHGGVTKEATYVDDALDGDYAEWTGGCVKTTQGRYIAGKKDGLWFTWTDKGVLQSEGAFKLDKEDGVWKFYDGETGSLIEEGPYVDGKREGEWTEYFANAYKWRTVTYVGGKRALPGVEACEAKEGQLWNVDFTERAEGCYAGIAPFGQRVGPWTFYYDTAETRRTETYNESGVLDGPYMEFHKNGKPLAVGAYKGGIPDGAFVWSREDGSQLDAFTISAGSGEWRAWHPDAKPREQGRFEAGKKTGEWTVWFPNGNKDRTETFFQNVEHGPMKAWYNTGELKVEGEFAAGNRAGTWTAYYSNGRVVWHGAYDDDGNRTGVWENFFWEGGLKSRGTLKLDAEDGPWSFYYETGELSAEGAMVAGKRNGPWLFYWKNGDIWREVTYENGVEVGTGQGACEDSGGNWVQMVDERAAGCQVCRWKPQGEGGGESEATPVELDAGEIPEAPVEAPETPVTPDGVAPDGAGADPAVQPHVARGEVIKAQEQQWVFWYPNGKKEKEGFYSKGKSQGQWTFWYENGQVMLRGSFIDGVEHGQWEGFYPDGTKRFAGNFVAGKEDGDWSVFGTGGAKLMEGRYDAGKKVGTWTYYDDAGHKRDEGAFVDDEETGVWTSFWPSGAIKCEGTYEAGKRVGVWVWKREDGSEWRKATYVDGREARGKR